MKYYIVLFICNIIALLHSCSGDTWIDYPWPNFQSPSEIVSLNYVDDIVGRRLTGVQLHNTGGSFICSTGQLTYWGCDNVTDSNFFYQVTIGGNRVAPSPQADPRVTSGRTFYSIQGINVTDSTVFLATDFIVTSDIVRMSLISGYSNHIRGGSTNVKISLRLAPYYTLASKVPLNARNQLPDGDFIISNRFNNKLASRFRFIHESGFVSCSTGDESDNNWGCNSVGFHGYCFAVFQSPKNFTYSNIIVPSDVDPRIFRQQVIGYIFLLNNAPANRSYLFQETVELETNLILKNRNNNNNNNYTLQFCEPENDNVGTDNRGIANVTIQASFESWTKVGEVTLPMSGAAIFFSFPNQYVGQTLRYIRLLHMQGSFNCAPLSNHRWGCTDPSHLINETFYLRMRNGGSSVIFPNSPNDRGFIYLPNGSYKYMGQHLDDDSIVYETNVTVSNTVVFDLVGGARLSSDLKFAVYITTYNTTFAECDQYSGFNAYTGGIDYVWCGICRFGTSGNGRKGSCVDDNECKTIQNPCGIGATCVNTPGWYNCTCANNTIGDPYKGSCISCGNDVCDTDRGENCANCRKDCTQDACQICGDGTCEAAAKEDCTTCYEDCGACPIPGVVCPGTPECSGNGICKTGICTCTANFSGPACDKVVQPITIVKNDSSPDVTFAPATNSDVTFQFAVFEIREIQTSTNEVVQSIFLENATFTSVSNTITNATQATYELTAVLSNRAILSLSIWIFTENTDIPFVGEILSFSANSIKFNVVVKTWPFKSAGNKLWLITSQNSPSEGKNRNPCGDTPEGVDGSGNLRFSQIQIADTILYGRFLEYASIDGRKRILEVKQISQTPNQIIVAIVVPFFYETAIIDPDMSVLVAAREDQEERVCIRKKDKDGITKTVIIIIAVSTIGGAIIIAVIVVLVTNRRKLQRSVAMKSLFNRH